jgi:hypothetical protein
MNLRYLSSFDDCILGCLTFSTALKNELYSEFFLRLAIGFYMLIFQPPVNFCSDENIQTIFGTKLEDFLNYRVEASRIGDRQVLVEPTMALLWRPLDVLLFRRPKKYFFHNFFDGLGY